MAKKRGKVRHHKNRSGNPKAPSGKKLSMILWNLVLSVILFAVSFGLYRFLANPILKNFFWMLALIFGFVGLAFLIIYLIFAVLKVLKK